MVLVVLPLAFAMLVVVLERLVAVKGVIVDEVAVAVVSVAVIGSVVAVVVGLTMVLSVVSADEGVAD